MRRLHWWGLAIATLVATAHAGDDGWQRVEQLWSLQPIRRPVPPPVAEAENPVDCFVGKALAKRGLDATGEADRYTLIRRAYFDLLGLPPTYDDVARFLRDDRPDAWSRLIDRLLASPRYGEQWARHWLDVVRYADTAGFSNDFERPNAWRYRDYVIRSFNQDKPFDRFIVEQIAGDELDGDDPEMLIAVGFLRMGPWEHTGMSVAAITRQRFLDDVTHSVGVTFLGLTLRCARCHDHKFDPISMRDYYSLQACFATTQLAERPAPFLPSENRSGFAEEQQRLVRKLNWLKEELREIQQKHQRAVAEFLDRNGYRSLKDVPLDRRPTALYGLDVRDRGLQRMFRKWIAYYEREQNRYRPLALSVYNGPEREYRSDRLRNPMKLPGPGDRLPETRILLGGNLATPGDVVEPGVPEVLREVTSAPAIPKGWTGRRLALARWIASEHNPLTARVIANRVWQHHFGNRGLVETPNNFGAAGAKPTHPELLDFLARWLIEHGWSLKRLHRLVMCSAVYRRASTPRDPHAVAAKDPQNRWLSYYPARRLAAEELRDAMLAVSDELNLAMGGPGAREEIDWQVALQPRHIMGTVAPAYQPHPLRHQRHRRSIYLFRIRTLRDPFLEVFNQPDSAQSCPRRDASTVPTQALALFNSRWSYGRAVALAQRVARRARHLEDRIVWAYRFAFARDPEPRELQACLRFLQNARAYTATPMPRWPVPRRVVRRMIEEVEGVEYTWTEELDQMQRYQPDPMPADLPSADERALAELCHVLLNTNEFIYVY